MKVLVRVVPGAKKQQIQAAFDGSLKVWLKAEAKEGRANRALVEYLAEYYKVGKSGVKILQGLANRTKIVEILE